MEQFKSFRGSLESKVAKIAAKTSSLHKNSCSFETAQCSKKSFSECQGTDEYECLNNFPKKAECLSLGTSYSKSSGVRLPNSIYFDALTNKQKLIVCATATLDETFKEVKLSQLDKIRRIYIGTEFGLFRGYPGLHQPSKNGLCTKDYDPRFRPWYVLATASPKNVILIIDDSRSLTSMSNRMLQIAQIAAKSLIDTLSQADYVGVIFSSSAQNGNSSNLQRADKTLKQSLKSKIDKISISGRTNYESLFSKAGQMFKSSKQQQLGVHCSDPTNIVLFITRGEPTEGEATAEGLINKIDQWSNQFNIKLFSFEIGQSSTSEILRKLSCRYEGIVFNIQNTTSNSDVLNIMRNYYIYLAQGLNIAQPVWSGPYIDSTTGAQMMTVSMPIYEETENSLRKIQGVVGIDVLLEYFQGLGIAKQNITLRLIKDPQCRTLSLNPCQIQYLRPTQYKCNISNCTSNQPFNCSNFVNGSIISYPPVNHKPLEQCCGLTIRVFVGTFVGLFVGVMILAVFIIRYCYRRHRQYHRPGGRSQNLILSQCLNIICPNPYVSYPTPRGHPNDITQRVPNPQPGEINRQAKAIPKHEQSLISIDISN